MSVTDLCGCGDLREKASHKPDTEVTRRSCYHCCCVVVARPKVSGDAAAVDSTTRIFHAVSHTGMCFLFTHRIRVLLAAAAECFLNMIAISKTLY